MEVKYQKPCEKFTLQLEERTPEFVDPALNLAYAKPLTSGSPVLMADYEKLLESSLYGSRRVTRSLLAPALVPSWSERIRHITQ